MVATPAKTPPTIAPLRDEEDSLEAEEVGACTTVVLIPGMEKVSKLVSPVEVAVKLKNQNNASRDAKTRATRVSRTYRSQDPCQKDLQA